MKAKDLNEKLNKTITKFDQVKQTNIEVLIY